MIQIDDAGSGSLIGGTGIGILNTINNKYYFDIIPLGYYQTPLYYTKAYQDYVIKIVQIAFQEVGAKKQDPIEICQGYMFDKLRKWLTEEGFSWKNTQIEGDLQQKVEESFNKYVISLGLPNDFVKHARYAFGFHRLLKWVFADLENRKILCKTEWKSWKKWCKVEKSIYQKKLTYQDFCLKCGERIVPPLKVITIEYITTKPATINLHPKCYKGDLKICPPSFMHKFETRIKRTRNRLDSIEKGHQLFLDKVGEKVVVVNDQNIILGYFKDNLEEKIAFWLKKGFNWKCNLISDHDNELLVRLSLSG